MTYTFSYDPTSNKFNYECSARVWGRFDEDIEFAYVGSDVPLDETSILEAWSSKMRENHVADKFTVKLK